jgi:hypothetical protein
LKWLLPRFTNRVQGRVSADAAGALSLTTSGCIGQLYVGVAVGAVAALFIPRRRRAGAQLEQLVPEPRPTLSETPVAA